MATLSYKSRRALVQWHDPNDGQRRSLRAAVPSQAGAEILRTHVGLLVTAKAIGAPIPQGTLMWLREVGDAIYAKLVRRGLVTARQTATPVRKFGPKARAALMVTYFIQGDTGTPIKIGKTFSVAQRLAELQCGSPYYLRCLGTLAGDHEDELHRQFGHLRMLGEWFRPEPELMDFIGREARS